MSPQPPISSRASTIASQPAPPRAPFWRPERIGQKLSLAFLLLLAILAGYGATTYLGLDSVQRNVTEMEADSMLAMQAAHLQRLSETSLVPVRDYVLTGDSAAEDRFHEIAVSLQTILGQMGVAVSATSASEPSPNPEMAMGTPAPAAEAVIETPVPSPEMESMATFSLSPEELGLLQELGRSWSELLAGAGRLFAIENPVGDAQALEDLRSLQPMAERMSAFAQSLHEVGMRDVRLSRESADATAARTVAFLVAAVALAIGVSLLLSRIIAGAISRPIVRLTGLATAISLGELDTRVEVGSRGEVGELAQALERMRTSLKMTIDRLSEEEEDLRSWTGHLVDRELRRKVRGGTIALGGQRYQVGRDLEGQSVFVRLDLDLREIVVTVPTGEARRLPLRG